MNKKMDQKPDLLEVLRAHGVDVDTQGGRISALCPFHDEKNPSFSIDPDKGLWFCFHDHLGGDVYDFVGSMKFGLDNWDSRNKVMFKEVVSILEEKNFKQQKITPAKREEKKKELTQNVLFLLGHVTQIYHQNLLQEKKAMSYLMARGLTEEFIRAHKLGFANGNLGVMLSMLPEDVYRDLAVEAGLIYVNTKGGRRWEFMKGRIAFPDIDRDGRVLGIIGRSLDQQQNPKYLTLNGLPKVIWGLHRFSQWQPLIIHESIMDACTAQLMGVPSCSPCGTGIAWHLVEELKKKKYLGFLSQDDDPSKRAIERWKEKIPHGRAIVGEYDGHKDLNEMATEVGWDAAKTRLFALLEKRGFEYEVQSRA
jgi:DNA primase